MILLDANILIYAHVESFTQHVAVKDWLDQQMNGSTRVAMGKPLDILAFRHQPSHLRTTRADL